MSKRPKTQAVATSPVDPKPEPAQEDAEATRAAARSAFLGRPVPPNQINPTAEADFEKLPEAAKTWLGPNRAVAGLRFDSGFAHVVSYPDFAKERFPI